MNQAVEAYEECLKTDESNEKAMLNLARLHMMSGNYDACERQLMVRLT